MTVWGETLCSLCRYRLAELVLEAEREVEDEPLCVPCADLFLERNRLELVEPAFAAHLAPLAELARESVA